MNRETLEDYNGKTEIVYAENGTILFVKKTTTHQGYQVDSDMVTVSGYGYLTDMNDIGFTHLDGHDFPQGAIVDFQYIDGQPERPLSDAKIGTLKVFDQNGNIISGESFKPDGFTRIVSEGKLIDDPNGISMSAPTNVKAIFGKNISEIKTVSHHK